mmetsp:Transcript_12129/g.19562  ORF Transcript_12129/g.19562 Transcript_12129/m.19562 type:complete len:117 (+) Transcript_12129:622-972(+)
MPFFIYTHLWADLIVDKRWAINIEVRFELSSCNDCTIALSVLKSKADVASSARRMEGCLRNARASAIRCFSPPDSFSPRSPTYVSYRLGILMILSWMWACLAASITSSSVADGRPY